MAEKEREVGIRIVTGKKVPLSLSLSLWSGMEWLQSTRLPYSWHVKGDVPNRSMPSSFSSFSLPCRNYGEENGPEAPITPRPLSAFHRQHRHFVHAAGHRILFLFVFFSSP
jgi:hypothetical protein